MKSHCSVEGCTGPVVARDLCDKHYRRLTRRGRLSLVNGAQSTCGVDDCDRPFSAKGLCRLHYQRQRHTGQVELRPYVLDVERSVWRFVQQDGACWRWTGYIDKRGYGRVGTTVRQHLGAQQAYRATYLLLVGEIPAGLQLDHLCRNTWCVNPYHLDPVTKAENTHRQHLSIEQVAPDVAAELAVA